MIILLLYLKYNLCMRSCIVCLFIIFKLFDFISSSHKQSHMTAPLTGRKWRSSVYMLSIRLVDSSTNTIIMYLELKSKKRSAFLLI